jgi:hypothetical protein
MCDVTPQLSELARVLADWAAPAVGTMVYMYGSRVRGDHRSDSDVDIFVDFWNPTEPDMQWWNENTDGDFASLKGRLNCRLEILEQRDPLAEQIRAARVTHRDRNVRCVWLPPKPFGFAR